MRLNVYKAVWVQYLVRDDNKSEVVEQIVYFIGDHGNIYQIAISAKAGKMYTIKKEIDTVLNSFKIL